MLDQSRIDLMKEIAAIVAASTRDQIVRHSLRAGDLVSVQEESIRYSLASCLADDVLRPTMMREIYRALGPVALEHAFCDVHIWYGHHAFVSITHEALVTTIP